MKKLFYDFHNHSCLSPCADNDMTPNNMAGMAKLAGLQAMALTDHNASRNCPAFFEAAERMGIIPFAGMELTTAEDIHIVFLFEELEAALDFDADLQSHRMLIPNRVDIFGDQLLMDGEDEIIGTEPHFLTNATDIIYEDTRNLAGQYGGVSYPAHIDREANGVIATLGTLPEDPDFRQVEFRDFENIESYRKLYPNVEGKQIMYGSDAHYLWQIQDADHYLELPDEVETPEEIKTFIFQNLRG